MMREIIRGRYWGGLLLAYGFTIGLIEFETAYKVTAEDVKQPVVDSKSIDNSETDFESLFDGRSLDLWEGNLEWFRIEEDAIVAGSLEQKIPHNEFLCTRKRYQDFELRLEAKIRGQGNNAGVQFRTERIPNHTEVSGYQADAGVAFKRPVWGSLYDESRRKKMLAEGPADQVATWAKTDDWNELRIRAEGNRIQIWLNGHPTVDYTEQDPAIPRDGIIALQIHSGLPTEALYRKIRIQVLETQ